MCLQAPPVPHVDVTIGKGSAGYGFPGMVSSVSGHEVEELKKVSFIGQIA